MIIYKETIKDFLLDIKNDNLIFKICSALEHKKGIRPSEKEKDSWQSTLINMADELDSIENKNEQFILLEFVIPNHKKRIDVILIGSDNNYDNLAIIELKGWSKIESIENSKLLRPNTSYAFFGLSHPAYEIMDYFKILSDEYSDINQVYKIYPISYLPNYEAPLQNILNRKIYEDITSEVKIYWKTNKQQLIDFFQQKFQKAIDVDKVNFLDRLKYKPSLSLLEHAHSKFEDINLIGSQRTVFETIASIIDINKNTNKKTAFIISGPAGSGKSIIAFKLLLKLIANGYHTRLMIPGIEFREAIKKQFSKMSFTEKISGAYAKSFCDYAIIDEAHKATANGTTKQFYETLLRNNKNVILFLDDLQVINKKGITKKQFIDIATSSTHNFACVQLELEEQFRNAGDATYIDWLKHMIFNEQNNQIMFIPDKFNFTILPGKQFNKQYQEMYELENVRLVSFWTQRWDVTHLINGMPKATVKIADFLYTWNPNNEFLKKVKENNLIPSKELYKLCEKDNFLINKKGFQYIAYFNTIQGSEFDYIFVHIPKLFFLNQNNELDVNFNYLKDEHGNIIEEMRSQLWSLKNINDDKEQKEKQELNKLYWKNRLFICLTRATKGAYVYFEDEKLEKYFRQKVGNN